MAFYTEALNSTAPLTERFRAAYAGYIAAAEKRAAYKQTVRELSQLSHRELADLGISRGEIRSLAYDAAYGAS